MGSLRIPLVAGARSLDLAPPIRRVLTLLLVVALAGDGAAPLSVPHAHPATLKPLESAESGLEEELRVALAPPSAIATAGMEEKPEKPSGISRRTFLQWLQLATGLLGSSPAQPQKSLPPITPEIAGLLAGTLRETAAAIRRAPTRLEHSVIGTREAVAELAQEWQLSETAAVLRALQAYRLPNGQWREEVSASRPLIEAEQELRDAGASWAQMSERSWRKGDRAAIWPLFHAALDAQGQFEFQATLESLAVVLSERVSTSFPAESQRAAAANLTTDEAQTAYLLQRAAAILDKDGIVRQWEREAQQDLGSFELPPDRIPAITSQTVASELLAAARRRVKSLKEYEEDGPADVLHEMFEKRGDGVRAEFLKRALPVVRKRLRALGIKPRDVPEIIQWLRAHGLSSGVAADRVGWLDVLYDEGLCRHLYLGAMKQLHNPKRFDPERAERLHELFRWLILDRRPSRRQLEAAVRAPDPVAFLEQLRQRPARTRRRLAVISAPWFHLVKPIATLAEHGPVTVKVTTEARGLVQHVVATTPDRDWRAGEARLARLRAAGWPHAALANHAYTTVIPQGTAGPTVGRLLATFSASTWAAAPIRAVPAGPGPSGTGAGLEEGEKPGPKVSRRGFLKLSGGVAANTIVPGVGDSTERVAGIVGHATGQLDDLTEILERFQEFSDVDAPELVARQWRLPEVSAATQKARDIIAQLPSTQRTPHQRQLTDALERNQRAVTAWKTKMASHQGDDAEGDAKAVKILTQLLDAVPREQGRYQLLDLLVNLHRVLQNNRVASVHAAFDPAVFKDVIQLAAGVERDQRLQRIVAGIVKDGVNKFYAPGEQMLQKLGTSYSQDPPDYDALAGQLLAATRQRAAVSDAFQSINTRTPELVQPAMDARFAKLARASPRWKALVKALAARWREEPHLSETAITDLSEGLGSDDHIQYYVYNSLRDPERTEDEMFGDGIRRYLNDLARSEQGGIFSEMQVGTALRTASPEQLVAAARDPTSFLRSHTVTTLTPAPWHALAYAIAVTAQEGAVTVRVTTAATGQLRDVVWNSYGVDHSADATLLARLRAAGWPHEALRGFEYATVIPQGTTGPAIGHLLAALSASTWAAAPIRLQAGLEEHGQQEEPQSPWLITTLGRFFNINIRFTRREFFRGSAHVATTAVLPNRTVSLAAQPVMSPDTAAPVHEAILYLKEIAAALSGDANAATDPVGLAMELAHGLQLQRLATALEHAEATRPMLETMAGGPTLLEKLAEVKAQAGAVVAAYTPSIQRDEKLELLRAAMDDPARYSRYERLAALRHLLQREHHVKFSVADELARASAEPLPTEEAFTHYLHQRLASLLGPLRTAAIAEADQSLALANYGAAINEDAVDSPEVLAKAILDFAPQYQQAPGDRGAAFLRESYHVGIIRNRAHAAGLRARAVRWGEVWRAQGERWRALGMRLDDTGAPISHGVQRVTPGAIQREWMDQPQTAPEEAYLDALRQEIENEFWNSDERTRDAVREQIRTAGRRQLEEAIRNPAARTALLKRLARQVGVAVPSAPARLRPSPPRDSGTLIAAPWHRLAQAVALSAKDGAVLVRVTTVKMGQLRDIVWTSYGVDHSADATLLARLRAAGWPHDALRGFEYTTVIPQGTTRPAVGRLLATLSASTWAAAPIRATAGLEEGERPAGSWWLSRAIDRLMGVKMSRGTFVKQGGKIVAGIGMPANDPAVGELPPMPPEVASTYVRAWEAINAATPVIEEKGLLFGDRKLIFTALTNMAVAQRAVRILEREMPAADRWSGGAQWTAIVQESVARCHAAVRQRRAGMAALKEHHRYSDRDLAPDGQLIALAETALSDPAQFESLRWAYALGDVLKDTGQWDVERESRQAAASGDFKTYLTQRIRDVVRLLAENYTPTANRVLKDYETQVPPGDVVPMVDSATRDVLDGLERSLQDGTFPLPIQTQLERPYRWALEALIGRSPWWQREVVTPLTTRLVEGARLTSVEASEVVQELVGHPDWQQQDHASRLAHSFVSHVYQSAVVDRLMQRHRYDRSLDDAGVPWDSTLLNDWLMRRPVEELEAWLQDGPAFRHRLIEDFARPKHQPPPPWQELARRLADAAQTQTVEVTLRLDDTGILAELSWWPIEAPHLTPADAALLAQLRQAGWPRGGEPDGVYVWSIAPGSSPEELAAHLEIPLTDPAWERLDAVTPVRAATELDAGLEEGEKPGPEMSRRSFLKLGGVGAQAMAGGAIPEASTPPVVPSAVDQAVREAIATLRQSAGQVNMIPWAKSTPQLLQTWRLREAAAAVVAGRQQLAALGDAGRYVNGVQLQGDFESTIRAFQDAVRQGWLSPAGALVRQDQFPLATSVLDVVTDHPERYEALATLASAGLSVKGDGVSFTVTPEELAQWPWETLADEAARQAYLTRFIAARLPPTIVASHTVEANDLLAQLDAPLPPDRPLLTLEQVAEAVVKDAAGHVGEPEDSFLFEDGERHAIRDACRDRLEMLALQSPVWRTRVVQPLIRQLTTVGVPQPFVARIASMGSLFNVREWLENPTAVFESLYQVELWAYLNNAVRRDQSAGGTKVGVKESLELLRGCSLDELEAGVAVVRDRGPAALRDFLRERAQQVVRAAPPKSSPTASDPSKDPVLAQRPAPPSAARREAIPQPLGDAAVELAGRWAGQVKDFWRVAWTPPALGTPLTSLILYAPVSWWDMLTERWASPEREATAVRAIAAIAPPDAPGVLLLDETMPVPMAVAAMAPMARPVILRVAREDLKTATYDYLAFLASRPELRGQVLLYVPAFAHPVTVEGQTSFLLATELTAGLEEGSDNPPPQWVTALKRLFNTPMTTRAFFKGGGRAAVGAAVRRVEPVLTSTDHPAVVPSAADRISQAATRLDALSEALAQDRYPREDARWLLPMDVAHDAQLGQLAAALVDAESVRDALRRASGGPAFLERLATARRRSLDAIAAWERGVGSQDLRAEEKVALLRTAVEHPALYPRLEQLEALWHVGGMEVNFPMAEEWRHAAQLPTDDAFAQYLRARLAALIEPSRVERLTAAAHTLAQYGTQLDPTSVGSERIVGTFLECAAQYRQDPGHAYDRWLWAQGYHRVGVIRALVDQAVHAAESARWQQVAQELHEHFIAHRVPSDRAREWLKPRIESGYRDWLQNPDRWVQETATNGLRAHLLEQLRQRGDQARFGDQALQGMVERLPPQVVKAACDNLAAFDPASWIQRSASPPGGAPIPVPSASRPDPVRALAQMVSDAATTHSVDITVRLDERGALATVSWQPMDGLRQTAEEALLRALREAGWPRGGEAVGLYVWTIAPGTQARDIEDHLTHPLDAAAWYRLAAGLEEGAQSGKPAKPGDMSLRTFLKTTTMIPKVAQQVVAGTSAPAEMATSTNPELLATAKAVGQLEVLQRYLMPGHSPAEWELAPVLSPVAATLTQLKTMTHEWPSPVATAMHAIQLAAAAPLWVDSPWLVNMAFQHPEHYGLAQTVAGLYRFLQWRVPVREWLSIRQIFETYLQSGAPPLTTDIQRMAYLRPLLRERLGALIRDRTPAAEQQLEGLTDRILEHAERILTPYYGEWRSRALVNERLEGDLRRFLNPRWGAIMREVERRWGADGIPVELREGVLRRQLDHARDDWLRRPGSFVEGMRLHGRLVAELSKRGWLTPEFAPGPELIWALSQEERAAALQAPGAWAEQWVQRVQAQRAGVVRDIWAAWGQPQPVRPPRVLSRAEAEDVTLQLAARWGGRIGDYGRLPWTPPAPGAAPAPLVLYASEAWWEPLRATMTLGQQATVAFESLEAVGPGVRGVVLLDQDTPIPAALAEVPARERPIILRVTVSLDLSSAQPINDLRTLTYDYLAFLASQEQLRGQALLWVPAFAERVVLDDAMSYYLATEA